MRRLLTAGIFGTILGIVGAYSTANASIVSSGFLDEKLTEYALSTSLDLKANQSDFTELNTQISDSIANLKTLWDESIRELAYAFDPNKVNNNINGAFDLVAALISESVQSLIDGWTDSDYGKTYQGIKELNDGWTDSNRTTYLGVKDLNTKIGTLPDGITLENFYNGWVNSGGESMAKYIATQGGNGTIYTYDPVNDDTGPSRFPDGYLGVLARLITGDGFAPYENSVLAPFWYLTKQAMRVGEIPHGKTAAGMIDEINTKIGTLPDGKNLAGMIGETDTKIGTLPSGITVQGMLNGWTDGPYTLPGLFSLSIDAMKFEDFYGERVGSIFSYGLDEFTSQEYTGPIYPLWKLSQGIGTLPSGNFPDYPGYDFLFPFLNRPLTYPTSLAELITAIYGDGEPGRAGLLAAIIAGFPYDSDQDGRPDDYIGLMPIYGFAKNIYDSIGPLPAEIVIGNSNGAIDMFNITKLQEVSLPKGYTVSDFIQNMYYGSFGSNVGLGASPFYGLSDIIERVMYGGIIGGANPDLAGKEYKGLIDLTLEADKIGTVPDGKNLAGMISETDAKIGTVPDGKNLAGMIGTLPAGYDSVGAALSAIKGIAEDAKAAALAAIPDPKQEGSSGKYVLTVDIVGDNATYHWEKIDREGETTTTE